MPREPVRTIRVPDDLWDAARAKAAERGVTVSSIMQGALAEFAYGEDDDERDTA